MKKTLLLLLLVLILSGCIRSRLIVSTEPEAVDVTINNVYQGRSPVEYPFLWYWYYEIELEKEGYQSLTALERLKAPPWFWFPLDLFMEMLPFRVYDTKYRFYVLKPEEPL